MAVAKIGVCLSNVPFQIPIPTSAAVAAVAFLGPAANYAISDPAGIRTRTGIGVANSYG